MYRRVIRGMQKGFPITCGGRRVLFLLAQQIPEIAAKFGGLRQDGNTAFEAVPRLGNPAGANQERT